MQERSIPVPNEARYESCFGCGSANAQGLQLKFASNGRGSIEGVYIAPPHYCGAPNVLHGGIQATLLDEAIGYAVRLTAAPDTNAVTAQFSLRYRVAVPLDQPILMRARVVREDGPHRFAEAALLHGDGTELTTATARWRVLD